MNTVNHEEYLENLLEIAKMLKSFRIFMNIPPHEYENVHLIRKKLKEIEDRLVGALWVMNVFDHVSPLQFFLNDARRIVSALYCIANDEFLETDRDNNLLMKNIVNDLKHLQGVYQAALGYYSAKANR